MDFLSKHKSVIFLESPNGRNNLMDRIVSWALKSYTAQRTATAVLVFGALLLGGRMIGQEDYASILLVLFLAKFLSLLNIGASSGFFVSYYGKLEIFDAGSEAAVAPYIITFALHLFAVVAPATVLSALFLPKYTAGFLAFLFLIPAYALEPAFRRRRLFYLSLVPDILLSLALLGVVGAVSAGGGLAPGTVLSTYMTVLASLCVGFYGLLLLRFWLRHGFAVVLRPLAPGPYLRLVRLGLPVFLGSAFYMLASGLDRLFLPLHAGTTDQAVYLLSFQLVAGAMIFMTSVNFVNTVDLGSAHMAGGHHTRELIVRKLAIGATIAAVSLITLLLGTYVLQHHFLTGYDELLSLTMTLGFGLALFYVAGAVTPVLVYQRKQVPMTLLMAGVAGLILTNNVLVVKYGWSIQWLALVTSGMIGVYGCIAVAYVIIVSSLYKKI